MIYAYMLISKYVKNCFHVIYLFEYIFRGKKKKNIIREEAVVKKIKFHYTTVFNKTHCTCWKKN